VGEAETPFERLHRQQSAWREDPWNPFEDKDEWELAEFLFNKLSKTSIEGFLKQPTVCFLNQYFSRSDNL
jgi:hypothetical protein